MRPLVQLASLVHVLVAKRPQSKSPVSSGWSSPANTETNAAVDFRDVPYIAAEATLDAVD